MPDVIYSIGLWTKVAGFRVSRHTSILTKTSQPYWVLILIFRGTQIQEILHKLVGTRHLPLWNARNAEDTCGPAKKNPQICPEAPTYTNTVNIRQCKLTRLHGFRFCQRSLSEQHSKSDFPIWFSMLDMGNIFTYFWVMLVINGGK